MSELGLNAMVDLLGSRRAEETERALDYARNKTIREAKLDGNVLELVFERGTLSFWDDGQDCCETRYITCDDDLSPFAGAVFLSAEVRGGPKQEDGEHHDTAFLIVKTSLGEFTATTHNVHNGHYGGFSVVAKFYLADKIE